MQSTLGRPRETLTQDHRSHARKTTCHVVGPMEAGAIPLKDRFPGFGFRWYGAAPDFVRHVNSREGPMRRSK